MRRNKIQIYQKCGKPVFKNPQRQTASVWGPVQCRRHTDFFAHAHPLLGQKTSLVNLNHKITTSANYTDGIGTGYTSHNKEICLHGKRLKNNFKINQSNYTCTDVGMKRTRGRGKKRWSSPPRQVVN